MPVIEYNAAKGFVIAILAEYRVGTDVYGSVDPELRFNEEIRDALLAADGDVAEAHCSQKTNAGRKFFLTGSAFGLAHGTQIPERIGPLESVQFVITGGLMTGTRAGREWPMAAFEELEREIRNPLLIKQIEPHWIMDGDTIYHNAAGIVKGGASSVSVNATFCTYTVDRATPSLKSPDWSFNAVVSIALGMLFPKDAENQGIRDSFKVQGENYLQAIRSGATNLAPLGSG